MAQFYTPDKERKIACFGCSVANALLELGDSQTAQLAYDNAAIHPNSESGEFRDILAGRTFRELTGNRYKAVLSRVKLELPLSEALKNNAGDKIGDILKALSEEQDNGLLRFVDSPHDLRVYAPSLLFVCRLNPLVFHSFVVTKRGGNYIAIDNGVIRSISDVAKEWHYNHSTLSDIAQMK